MKNRICSILLCLLSFCVSGQKYTHETEVPAVYSNDCFYKKEKKYIPARYLNILKFNENLAPVRIIDTLGLTSQTKTGFVNTSGQLVIPAVYDKIFKPFHKGIAIVGMDAGEEETGKGIIDKNNQMLVPPVFGDIGEIRNEFVLVRDQEGVWGFYNTALHQLSPEMYESIRFFRKDFFLVSRMGKRGLIDRYGKEILALRYKDILSKKDGSVETRHFSEFSITDFTGQISRRLECDSLLSLQKGLYKYSLNGKYGIITDTHAVSPVYDHIAPFHFGKAIVLRNNYFGMIDTSGQLVLPVIYDSIDTDSLGYIYIKGIRAKQFGSFFVKDKRKSWSVLDSHLTTVIPFQYKKVGLMGDSLFAALNDDDLWGYVDYSNHPVIPFKYHFAKAFKNGFASVGVREPYKKIFYFINKKNEVAVSPENYHVYAAGIGQPDSAGKIIFCYPFNSFHKFSPLGGELIKVKYGYKYGVATKSSDLIVSVDYDSVIYSPEQNCVIVYKDRLPGIFGAAGDTVHPLTDKYDQIYPFKEGYARVSKNGKFGCIDYNKNRRISIQYLQLQDFNEGESGAVINRKWGFLDRNEKLSVQPYYSEVRPFKNGIARVKTGQYWDFVDKDGKIINSALYQSIEETSTNKWLIIYNGKKGLADSAGKEMLVPRYDNASDLGNGYLQVWKDHKTGVLDYDQNFILPVEYNNLQYDKINHNFIVVNPGSVEKIALTNNFKSK